MTAASHRLRLGLRTLRVLLGAILLTTCSTDSALAPKRTAQGQFDASSLFQVGGEFTIPVDEVLLELRRVSDNTVAFSRSLTAQEYSESGDNLIIQISLDLTSTTEDFSFLATVLSGGVEYYRASGTVTATANQSITASVPTPTYTGPGNAADQIVFPATTTLVSGQVATLSATVLQGNTTLTGVPVAYSSSNTTLLTPVQQGINQATITAPATGSGSVVITAKTPNGISASGTVSWAPVAVASVQVTPATPTIQVAQTVQLSATARDANNNILTGLPVTWGSDALPIATVSPTGLVTGVAQGTATITATIGGVDGTTLVTVTPAAPGVPATVTALSITSQNVVVNQFATAPSVVVKDANGLVLSGITVDFAITAGGGSVTGATQVTDGQGIATVGSWKVGQAAGVNTMTATVSTLQAVTFNATGTAGPAASVVIAGGNSQTGPAGSALPTPLEVEVRDAFSNPVPLALVAWATADGGSLAPASGPTDASGHAQSSWTLGLVATSQSATATVGTLPPVTFTATVGLPQITLSFPGTPGVGIGLTATVNVTLASPAGANGVSVAVTSQNTSLVSVIGSPVFIPQGQTAGTVTIQGGSSGTTTITGQAPGYTSGVLSVDVQNRAIALPLTINVPYGQTTQIPVQIGAPAPVGGVDIAVVSSAPGFVAVQTSPVHITAGAITANATLIGVLPGAATITASNPAYNFATSTATTTAALNIVQTSATLNASFGTSITINFESNGQPTAAPSPGIPVSLVSGNPACLSAPATVTIPTGLVSIPATLTYGGGPVTLPCTTTLTAQATSLTQDQINVTVNPVPVITMFTPAQGTGRLGIGLQDQGSGSLQVANPGPGTLTVHLVSSAPSALLLAPDAATPGQPTLDIQVPANQSSFSYFIQGVGAGTATITASATGYSNGTSSIVTLATPGFDILGLPGSTTSLSVNDPFLVRLGVPNAVVTGLSAEQAIRAGGTAVTATITNSNATAARLVTTTDTSQQVTVTIPVGQARSGNTVAAGGVEFDPLGAGFDTVTASIPGFVIFPGAPDSVAVTVTAPVINMFTPAQGTGRLGIGLQDQGSGSLQVSNPGPGSLTVHLVSSDAAALLLAPDAVTPGQPTLDVQVPVSQSSFSYFIQGVGAGTATITASAPAYSNGTSSTVTLATPGFDILGLPGTTTSLSANDPFIVRVGVPNAAVTGLSAEQAIRAGGTAATAAITNSNASAAQLVTTATTGQLVSVTIPVGQARSGNTVAAGGVEFDPLGAGFDTVSATIPGFVIFPGAPDSVAVSISAPAISMFTPAQGTGRLGVGLQDQGSGSLQVANPGPGALTVHLVSSNPSALLLSADAITTGQPTLDVTVPINGSSFSYFIQGAATGTATIAASATGYTSATSPTVTVVTPGFDILGLPGTTTSLSANDPFLIRLGAPNAGNTGLSVEQAIRAGGAAVTATITNSNAPAAQLVTTVTTGQQVTVTIPVGQARSGNTVAAGGVEFDPLGAGFDTVSASIPGFVIFPGAPDSVAVSVTAPGINMFTPAQGTGRLGAGLQDQGSGSLQVANPGPGVRVVHLVSSQPSILLLAPDASTVGQPTIDIQVPLNGSSFSYFVQGVENTSGTPTITASASGYTNATTTVTVGAPGFDILGLPGTTTTLSANDPFLVRLGSRNVGNTGLAAEQAIRAGGTALSATITNRNATAAQLVTTAVTGQVVGVTIPIGQARSPSTVLTGGVEFDPVGLGVDTVAASIPGFAAFPGAPDSVAITVSAPVINMFTPAQGTGRLGNGLQDQGSGSLQVVNPGPGALTVHLVSSNSSALLLAPDAATPGQPTLDVSVPLNGSSFSYFIQGVGTGTATITASATGYSNGITPTVTVAAPGFDILGLTTSTTAASANDPFLVRLGVPNITLTALAAEQSVRAGATAVTATISNSNQTAAQLVTTVTTGQLVSVSIPVGQARSAATVAAGGVEFDPLASGTTTVSAGIVTYVVIPASAVTVNVSP